MEEFEQRENQENILISEIKIALKELTEQVKDLDFINDREKLEAGVGKYHDKCQEIADRMGDNRDLWFNYCISLGYAELIKSLPEFQEYFDEALEGLQATIYSYHFDTSQEDYWLGKLKELQP